MSRRSSSWQRQKSTRLGIQADYSRGSRNAFDDSSSRKMMSFVRYHDKGRCNPKPVFYKICQPQIVSGLNYFHANQSVGRQPNLSVIQNRWNQQQRRKWLKTEECVCWCGLFYSSYSISQGQYQLPDSPRCTIHKKGSEAWLLLEYMNIYCLLLTNSLTSAARPY